MMPFIKTAALCRQSRLLVERSTLELMKFREQHLETCGHIVTGRTYLQTAGWSPLNRSHEPQAGLPFSLPTVRNGDTGWDKRAQEARYFAGKIEDAGLKREMMELAERYEKLGDCGLAPNLPVDVPSHFNAIAA